MARQIFSEAIIDNRTVVAVKPRPELLPFFESVNWCVGGSDGDRSRGCILPAGALVIAAASPLRFAGRSRRPAPGSSPRRKLTPGQEAAILALAHTTSLRSLAADFDVSHETIRTVLRSATSA